MRISGGQNMDVVATGKAAVANNSVAVNDTVGKTGSAATANISRVEQTQQAQTLDNSEETKAKVQEAVNTMNEMLEVNNNSSKFMYHEGLERYYVTIVDRETEEVMREIPAKKLLDAFYEMQKMLGMIVDEKI